MAKPQTPSKRPGPAQTELRWLVRFARHCGMHTEQHDSNATAQALRQAFGAAAWRIVCRSPRASFLPILRNRELSIHSLISYCQELAKRSFTRAPQPILLAYFVRQHRLFFDRPCRIPSGNDYDLMRVADRHRVPLVLRDIARVAIWAHETRAEFQSNHKWGRLIQKALKHNEHERVRLASAHNPPWHFFCKETDWLGYRIKPITDAEELWHAGQRHGNCLYKLSNDYTKLKPSRFFNVIAHAKSVAIMELVWRPPEADFKGMDLIWGRWELQDLRLSYNRLPDAQLLTAMKLFAGMYNTWSKRPRRLPNDHAEDLRERLERLHSSGHWSGWRPSLWRPDGASSICYQSVR